MRQARPSVAEHRATILEALGDLAALHTSEIAEEIGASYGTVRRHLLALKDAGLVEGIEHDERDSLGRAPVHWSLTDRGFAEYRGA